MSEQSQRDTEGAGASSRRTFLRTGGMVAAGGVAAAATTAAMLPTAAGAGELPPGIVPIYLPTFPPTRIYDNRGFPKIQPNQQITLVPQSPWPPEWIAITVNLTVTQTVAAGYLAMFPGDVSWPGNSSINWFTTNEDVANNALSALSETDQSVIIRCGGQGPTQFLLDLIGVITLYDTGLATSVEDASAAVRQQIQSIGNVAPLQRA